MSAPRTDSPHDPALTDRGRTLTLAVLWALFLLTITPFAAGLLQGQTGGLGRNLIYAAGTALLLNAVWRGGVWAWRVTISLCMVAGLVVFVVGMLVGFGSAQSWVVVVAGLTYLVLGTALVGTPAIRAFLDSRWAARARR